MASNVTVRKTKKFDSNEYLIRKFKKKCEKAGILKDLRSHEEYMSPSQKRREKSKQARIRKLKDEKKKAKYLANREDR